MSPGTKIAVIVTVLATCSAAGYVTYTALLPEAPRALEPASVHDLPDFALPDLNGTPRPIRDWANERGLIVNFWATWCAPCLREIPLLTDFQATNSSLAQVVGIAVDRLADVTAFAPDMDFNYPILVGEAEAMEAAQAFGVDFLALPFTVFTAPQGQVLAVHTGEITAGDLDNYAAVLADIATGRVNLGQARERMAGRL